MQVLCFGEHEVSANTTPTTIGSLGDFVTRPLTGGHGRSSRPLIISGPSKKKSKSCATSATSIRRSLHNTIASSASASSTKRDDASPLPPTPSASCATPRAIVISSAASTSGTGTRSKAKAAMPPKPIPCSAITATPVKKGGAGTLSAVAGGMLAALGVMPQLGSTPSRGGGSAACKSKTGGSLSVHKSLVTSAASSSSSWPVKKEGAEGGGKGAPVPRDPSKLCKCKKSKCVRQYCVCFRAGLLCEGCDCSDCLNDGAHEVERLAAIQHIKTSDPLAFVDKIRPEVLFLSHTHTHARKHSPVRCRTLAGTLSFLSPLLFVSMSDCVCVS